MIKLLIWNVQGPENSCFIQTLKEHIRTHSPHIIALLEPRISNEQADHVCDQVGLKSIFRVEAEGFSGGIWILRNPEDINIQPLYAHPQHLTIKVKPKDSGAWLFSAIYGCPINLCREDLWNDLKNLASSIDLPWLYVGDYNDTINMQERKGYADGLIYKCQKFANLIDDMGLIDLGFTGPKYTWSRGKTIENRKCARLDRALCNVEWRMLFPEATMKHLLTFNSDHCPLLVNTNGFTNHTQ